MEEGEQRHCEGRVIETWRLVLQEEQKQETNPNNFKVINLGVWNNNGVFINSNVEVGKKLPLLQESSEVKFSSDRRCLSIFP